MENTSRNTVITAFVIGLLLILSAIFFFNGKKNKNLLRTEKQSTQSLLDKNDKIVNELNIIQQEYNGISNQVNELIKEKEQLIAENNNKIQRLISENKAGNAASKQIKEIEKQNVALQDEIKALAGSLADLEKKSADQAGVITELERENNLLTEQNNQLRALISNNIKVTATKGKQNKLTVVAARTNLITAYMDIPAAASNDISFTLMYPDGTSISSKDESTASVKVVDVPEDKRNEGNVAGYTEAVKSLELKYAPKKKLPKGVYKLSIYNSGDYITGVYISLK